MTEALQILLAYFIADALAGLYHLFTDRGWNIETQTAFFQNHHERPWTMTFDLQPLVIGAPVALTGLFVYPWFMVPLGLFLGFAQIPHYYVHHPAPWFIKVLQKCRIFLPPKSHHKHHCEGFNSNFCVISGWNDWWINLLARVI